MGRRRTSVRSKLWGTMKRRIVPGMGKKGLQWTGMEGVFPYTAVCGSDVLYIFIELPVLDSVWRERRSMMGVPFCCVIYV